MPRHARNFIASASLLALALAVAACKGPGSTDPANAPAGLATNNLQCGKDTDCKGERICDAGQCVAPDAFDDMPEPEKRADPYACGEDETLLFHCTTTYAKMITLCDAGSSLRYTFGKLDGNDPELSLSVARDAASTSQGPAAQTIDLPNGNTTYSVFWGVDRMSDAHEVEAGVHVQANGRHVATVSCKEDMVQSFMEDVDLKPTF